MISLRKGLITGGSYTQINLHGNNTWFRRMEENVAQNAFHNSHARFDPPKCHPNTRVAVIQKIMNWLLHQDPEMQQIFIMWLHGAAGAGKSAIAQTIAEICHSRGLLIASFFFSRSDGTRNHSRSLVATIAYQMILSLPQVKDIVVGVIEQDPLIFTRSLPTQFHSLVINPIQHLSASGFFSNPSSPRLIVIDGLDECLDHFSQREILDIILRGTKDHHLPLVFLVASRPEHDISGRFNSADMSDILNRLLLDHSYMPERDIELFLRDKFKEIRENHPFKHLIPSHWPTDEAIKQLIEKSSGQFIYASTVIKYVNSSRHRPHHRLEVIFNIRPAHGDSPFAELDALYTHIFSAVTEIDKVLHVIAFRLSDDGFEIGAEDIEAILFLEDGDIQVLFCDMSSVISIETYGKDRKHRDLVILHASLPDFLLDKMRSGRFYIDLPAHRIEIVRESVQYLTVDRPSAKYDRLPLRSGYFVALRFIGSLCSGTLSTLELLDAIRSISIPVIYDIVLMQQLYDSEDEYSFMTFVGSFLPDFFRFLKYSGFNDIYIYHLKALDYILKRGFEDQSPNLIFERCSQIYYSEKYLTFLIAVVDFAIHHPDHLEDVLESSSEDSLGLHSGWVAVLNCEPFEGDYDLQSYFPFLYDFLNDSLRTGRQVLNGTMYSVAAGCCLRRIYFCPDSGEKDLWVKCLIYLLDRAAVVDELRELCSSLLFSALPAGFKDKELVRRVTWDYLTRSA